MIILKCVECFEERHINDIRIAETYIGKDFICDKCLKSKKKEKSIRKKELEEQWKKKIYPERLRFYKAQLEKEGRVWVETRLKGEEY